VTHTLLFELGTEELPPSEMSAVLPALEEIPARLLEEARLDFEPPRVFTTPRRLAIVVTGLADRQPARVVTVTGPPKKAGLDVAGKPTKAGEGFARSQGVPVDRLITIQTERGEYLAVERREAGRSAAEVLPVLLERLVFSLPFSKQMRWGDGDVRFVRPIRWVVALLDGEVLALTIAGVAAGRITYGHRFLAPGPIELRTSEPQEYVDKLLSTHVIADYAKRRGGIQEVVEEAASERSLRAVVDSATLNTVVHLVESPTAIMGTFAEGYLKLPRVVIETTIRRHQKCFSVERPDGGLAPFFIAVSNMPGVDPAEIRRGNERVIRARLADADFYFREDRKMRLEERRPLLKGIVFQERLGTLDEKTERVADLAMEFGGAISPAVRQAARLAKADLASGMVREFPELEGIIGAEYARRDGEPEEVACAIREQYLPRSADDHLPDSLAGAVLSMADKLDTIVGCIGVGLLPTGSQDPYGLRRQAQGFLQTALKWELPPSLSALVDRALQLVEPKLTQPVAVTRGQVLEFFRIRLATLLMTGEGGLRPDVVEAVMAAGYDNAANLRRRAHAVAAFRKRPDFESLLITFKRVVNILPADFSGNVDPGLFQDPAEGALLEALGVRRNRIRDALREEAYETALEEIAALRPWVDQFFTAVLVMVEDRTLQRNRLALLAEIANLLLPVADLRRLAS